MKMKFTVFLVAIVAAVVVIACSKKDKDSEKLIAEGFYAADNYTSSEVPLVAFKRHGDGMRSYLVYRVKYLSGSSNTSFNAGGSTAPYIPEGGGKIPGYGFSTGDDNLDIFFESDNKKPKAIIKKSNGKSNTETVYTYYPATQSDFINAAKEILKTAIEETKKSNSAKLEESQETFCKDLFAKSCADVLLN